MPCAGMFVTGSALAGWCPAQTCTQHLFLSHFGLAATLASKTWLAVGAVVQGVAHSARQYVCRCSLPLPSHMHSHSKSSVLSPCPCVPKHLQEITVECRCSWCWDFTGMARPQTCTPWASPSSRWRAAAHPSQTCPSLSVPYRHLQQLVHSLKHLLRPHPPQPHLPPKPCCFGSGGP